MGDVTCPSNTVTNIVRPCWIAMCAKPTFNLKRQSENSSERRLNLLLPSCTAPLDRTACSKLLPRGSDFLALAAP